LTSAPSVSEALDPAPDWARIAQRLESSLHLSSAPVAITFSPQVPRTAEAVAVEPFALPLAPENEAGRTGRVAAGCVFWSYAATEHFSTVAEDHANCSVGSVTHGFNAIPEVVGNDDIGELLGSGWVNEEAFSTLPVVTSAPEAVIYGPLASTTVKPDVILMTINARALMTLKDAVPDLAIEGKPQCHIIAIAKETAAIAASVGCALSRARTGMSNEAMTCAVPASVAADLVDRLEREDRVNGLMARYAGVDARRFDARNASDDA